jgi:glutamine amidotransferase
VSSASRLYDGIRVDPYFYFLHSQHLVLAEDSPAECCFADYGGRITASVEMGNIFGVQFHPEKSQGAGLRLLSNFADF